MFSEGNHHTPATLVFIVYCVQYPVIQDIHLCLDSLVTSVMQWMENSIIKTTLQIIENNHCSPQWFLQGLSTSIKQLSHFNVYPGYSDSTRSPLQVLTHKVAKPDSLLGIVFLPQLLIRIWIWWNTVGANDSSVISHSVYCSCIDAVQASQEYCP